MSFPSFPSFPSFSSETYKSYPETLRPHEIKHIDPYLEKDKSPIPEPLIGKFTQHEWDALPVSEKLRQFCMTLKIEDQPQEKKMDPTKFIKI